MRPAGSKRAKMATLVNEPKQARRQQDYRLGLPFLHYEVVSKYMNINISFLTEPYYICYLKSKNPF